MLKKVCSLTKNGKEILSVEIETVDWLPTPKVNKTWLRNLIAESLREHSQTVAPALEIGPHEWNCTTKAETVPSAIPGKPRGAVRQTKAMGTDKMLIFHNAHLQQRSQQSAEKWCPRLVLHQH
jgi:hypothetical protein